MAYRKCPSCGQVYNGKRCGNCYYEPFGEVTTSYELRREEAPRRAEIPPRPYTGRQTKKKPGAVGKGFAAVWGVLMILMSIGPVLLNMVEDVGSSFVEATPEPVPLPMEGLLLYEDADILVLADWDGITPVTEDVPIYVQNFSSRDLVVCTDGVAVNGCMTNDVFFYCDAYRNSVSRTTLWVDMETLGEMGIGSVEGIQMAIDIRDDDSYDLLVDSHITGLGGDFRQDLYTDGTVIYDRDGFLLVYQGWDEDRFGDPRLRFYAENNTECYQELSGSEFLIDGEETDSYLWQNFFPGTKAVIYGNLYDFEITGDSSLVELELFLTPDGDWDREIETGVLSFQLN